MLVCFHLYAFMSVPVPSKVCIHDVRQRMLLYFSNRTHIIWQFKYPTCSWHACLHQGFVKTWRYIYIFISCLCIYFYVYINMYLYNIQYMSMYFVTIQKLFRSSTPDVSWSWWFLHDCFLLSDWFGWEGMVVSDHLNSLDVSDLPNWVLFGKKLELTIGFYHWM